MSNTSAGRALVALPLFVGLCATLSARPLVLREDPAAGTLSVFRAGESKALLTQNAAPDSRPYLHPLVAPDGKGVLTEFSPAHHRHQTGIYWGTSGHSTEPVIVGAIGPGAERFKGYWDNTDFARILHQLFERR